MMFYILVWYFHGQIGVPAPGWRFATWEVCMQQAAYEHARMPEFHYGCTYTYADTIQDGLLSSVQRH
jgi:hypothetical protein